MKIFEVKERTQELVNTLLEVWENSVKATHLFLSDNEILKEVAHLIVIENENDIPIAFMGIEGTKLEMLFIKNSERRKGLGRQLLNYGIKNYNINELIVNEQNPNSKGFYEHLGFKVYKRTELDEQGNHYPILYMRLEN